SEIAWNHVLHDPKDRPRVVDLSRCYVNDDQVAHEIAEIDGSLDRPLGEILRSAPHDVSRFPLVTAESLGGNSFIQTLASERGLVFPQSLRKLQEREAFVFREDPRAAIALSTPDHRSQSPKDGQGVILRLQWSEALNRRTNLASRRYL